eukprot:4431417-Alexandrium_andersonii.AAC.1
MSDFEAMLKELGGAGDPINTESYQAADGGGGMPVGPSCGRCDEFEGDHTVADEELRDRCENSDEDTNEEA